MAFKIFNFICISNDKSFVIAGEKADLCIKVGAIISWGKKNYFLKILFFRKKSVFLANTHFSCYIDESPVFYEPESGPARDEEGIQLVVQQLKTST